VVSPVAGAAVEEWEVMPGFYGKHHWRAMTIIKSAEFGIHKIVQQILEKFRVGG